MLEWCNYCSWSVFFLDMSRYLFTHTHNIHTGFSFLRLTRAENPWRQKGWSILRGIFIYPMERTELVKEHPTCTYTLPETNSSHLKMDSLKITFLLGPGNFQGLYMLNFGVYICSIYRQENNHLPATPSPNLGKSPGKTTAGRLRSTNQTVGILGEWLRWCHVIQTKKYVLYPSLPQKNVFFFSRETSQKCLHSRFGKGIRICLCVYI